MNCLKAEEQFSAYVEDELDYPAIKAFERHIAGCESCHHEFTLFRESINLLHQLPPIEPSAHFDAALRMRLANTQAKPISPLWRRAFRAVPIRPVWALSGFAMIVLVVLVGIYFYLNPFVQSSRVEVALETNNPTVIRRYVLPDELGRQERPPLAVPHLNTQRPTKLPVFDETEVREEQQPRRIERNYILQTVSYTDAPTGGGL